MPIPDILTLDFDGVLCDGMQEYFEASRRTYMRIWPEEPAPGEELFAAFRDLRPVIMTGWEMPLLLRALAQGRPPGAMLQHWEAVRDELMHLGAPQGKALSEALTHTLDEVRRELGFSPEQIVVGKVARLFELKGHADVIEAARKELKNISSDAF
jgi:hypothetical protein